MGPLQGLRVVEMAGIGPGPFTATLLADMGADVVRVDRPPTRAGGEASARFNVLGRNRPSVAVDLKSSDGVEVVLRLVEQADVLLEGFRPGVMERLGLAPEVCLARNPRLVYGRMTGWGQDGPRALTAGHDIDYIAVSGVLGSIRRQGERPMPPLNLVGDFGGGGMFLAFGVLAAVYEAQRSGQGQVVDAAMCDGASYLSGFFFGLRASGSWRDEIGTNLLDTGAPFYEVYETADGGHVAVGAIEPQFYAELLRGMELSPDELPPQNDRDQWPAMKERFASVFRQRTLAEWCAIFDGTDACVAPVRSLNDVAADEHMQARGAFAELDGVLQPTPAPRFSRTPGTLRTPPDAAGASTDVALGAWGFSDQELRWLRDTGAVA